MYKKKRLVFAAVIYWLLLLYILAALIFWFIELQSQNRRMSQLKIEEIKSEDPAYASKSTLILVDEDRKTAQYIGEGSIFLLVISVGAVFLYRAVMRQIKLQQQQQNFMTAITHELKTPIAVAKLNLETLGKYNLDEVRKEKLIHSALEEINRLDSMANNILVSAQLESNRYQLFKDRVAISTLVLKTANDFNIRFPEKKWEIDVQPDLHLTGDSLLLQILFNNLIENAVKYSPKGSKITIRLKRDHAHIVLEVEDEGTGISPADSKKIFRKFYRIGNEETRTAKGTGLGLYLCKKIATDHKAQINVSDNYPVGSIFTVVFQSAYGYERQI
ncbi:MAG TPA: ATP-binding protein [Puia sp.]|nr:ATP-binding protein [Puia sp.]